AERGEMRLEPPTLRREETVASAVPGDDRADAAEILRGFRHVAVEDARRAERRPHRVEERESAAETEADDARPPRVDVAPRSEPGARGLEIGERRPLAPPECQHRPRDAEETR